MSDPMAEILTREDAAALLKVSPRTIQRLLKAGELPGRKVGGQWRFDRDQLRAWVRGERVAPVAADTQRERIETEAMRLGVELPELLVTLQQAARRRSQLDDDSP